MGIHPAMGATVMALAAIMGWALATAPMDIMDTVGQWAAIMGGVYGMVVGMAGVVVAVAGVVATGAEATTVEVSPGRACLCQSLMLRTVAPKAGISLFYSRTGFVIPSVTFRG